MPEWIWFVIVVYFFLNWLFSIAVAINLFTVEENDDHWLLKIGWVVFVAFFGTAYIGFRFVKEQIEKLRYKRID